MSERMDKRKAELDEIANSGGLKSNLARVYAYLLEKDDKDYYHNLAKDLAMKLFKNSSNDSKNEIDESGIYFDAESIYCDVMISSVNKYDPTKGAKFTTFFINQLKYAYCDAIKKQKKEILTDDEQYLDLKVDNSISAENEFWDMEERVECHMDLLYELMRIIAATKRTQKKMMTLFYTDDMMKIFSDIGFEKSREYRHEKVIYSSIESELVDYVYSDKVESFKDMASIPRKKLRQLIEYYDSENLQKDVKKSYDGIWGMRERENADREIELNLSNNIYISYLFVKEYDEKNRTTIPSPHPQEYVSKYRRIYTDRKNDLGKREGYIDDN